MEVYPEKMDDTHHITRNAHDNVNIKTEFYTIIMRFELNDKW